MAEIKYYGDLRTLCGRNEDSIPATTLTELLNAIQKRYGKEAKKAAQYCVIIVDSDKVLNIKKTKLSENSKVLFYPMS